YRALRRRGGLRHGRPALVLGDARGRAVDAAVARGRRAAPRPALADRERDALLQVECGRDRLWPTPQRHRTGRAGDPIAPAPTNEDGALARRRGQRHGRPARIARGTARPAVDPPVRAGDRAVARPSLADREAEAPLR